MFCRFLPVSALSSKLGDLFLFSGLSGETWPETRLYQELASLIQINYKDQRTVTVAQDHRLFIADACEQDPGKSERLLLHHGHLTVFWYPPQTIFTNSAA